MNLYLLFLFLAILPLVTPSVSDSASASPPPSAKKIASTSEKKTDSHSGKKTVSATVSVSGSAGSVLTRVKDLLYKRNDVSRKEPHDEKGTRVLTELKRDHYKRYNGRAQARDMFVTDVINKIPDLFPKSVKVSGLEYKNEDDKPMCQTEFTFKSTLGNVVVAEPKRVSAESQSVKVYFKLKIENPIKFRLYPQSVKSVADEVAVDATYNFNGDHKAIIALVLPTSHVLMEMEKNECVVQISGIRLSTLNDPKRSSKPSNPGFTYQMDGHWLAVGAQSQLLVETISSAIKEELKEKLKAKDHWICFDEKLDKEDVEEKKRVEEFKKNCGEGK